jgi:hypothetical protein
MEFMDNIIIFIILIIAFTMVIIIFTVLIIIFTTHIRAILIIQSIQDIIQRRAPMVQLLLRSARLASQVLVSLSVVNQYGIPRPLVIGSLVSYMEFMHPLELTPLPIPVRFLIIITMAITRQVIRVIQVTRVTV